MRLTQALPTVCLGLFLQASAWAAHPTVKIGGLDGDLQQNAASHVEAVLKDVDGWRMAQIQQLAMEGRQAIERSLQPHGYYDPTIKVEWRKRGTKWIFSYKVQPGRLTHIQKVNYLISGPGANDPLLREALAMWIPKQNDRFLHHVYEEQKRQILTTLVSHGYTDGELTQHNVRVDPTRHQAMVDLRITTGPHYHFGQLTVQQHPNTFDDAFLRRYAAFESGGAYSNEQFLDFQSALKRSSYFESVNVTFTKDTTLHQVNVNVDVTPKSPRHLVFGAGFGTDTGMRGQLGYAYRFLNEHGHQWRIDSRIAEKRQNWMTQYVIPGQHPATDQYALRLGLTREDIDHQKSDSRTLALAWESEYRYWKRIIELRYLVESFREALGVSSDRINLLLPSVRFIRSHRNDPVNPTYGWLLDWQLRGSVDTLASATTFLQTEVNFRYLYPGYQDGHWTFRTQLGATTPNTEDVPLSMRFFAGGDNSIRGYSYRSIGPTIPDSRQRDSAVGGKYLSVFSAEYEQPVWRQLSLAAFVDTGNAMDSIRSRFKKSFGGGIHWHSPVGPIRADIAHPIHEDGREREWRFHLIVGPEL